MARETQPALAAKATTQPALAANATTQPVSAANATTQPPAAAPATGSHSDSAGGSDSGSDSATESSSSSDSGERVRPVFLKRAKAARRAPPPAAAGAAVLAKAEHLQAVAPAEERPFDGTDDLDDVDPAREFASWQQREAARKQRDRRLEAEREAEKDDRLRRQMGLPRGDAPAEPAAPAPRVETREPYVREDHSRPLKYQRR